MPRIARSIFLLTGVFSSLTVLHAAPGDLDPTFGNGGKVTTNFGEGAGVVAMAIQQNGKIVAVGSVFVTNDSDSLSFLVARYEENGNLDLSFGNGTGRVITDFGPGSQDTTSAVAIQNDGKIVVAGLINEYIFTSRRSFGVARYDASGNPDPSFGGGTGRVTTDFGDRDGDASTVTLQSDGKIVVGGTTYFRVPNPYSETVFTLVRYDASGALDASFGGSGTGKVMTAFGGNDSASIARALVLQNDDKILVAGHYGGSQGNNVFALARYTANGILDASFGNGDGKVTTDLGEAANPGGIALQNDGKTVLAGVLNIPESRSAFALVRYTTTGELDTSFGNGTGKVITDFGGSYGGGANGLAVQGNGKIVAIGQAWSDNVARAVFALARYDTSGNLDTGFGGTGRVTTDFGPSYAQGWTAVAIQGDGKIMASGSQVQLQQNTLQYFFALARYEGDVPSPLVFIPGIAGSRLIGGSETGVHGNGFYLWPTVDPADLEDLNLRTGVPDVQAVDVVRDYAGDDVYGDFLTHLAQEDVYREFDLDEYPSRLTSSYMQDYALAHPDEPKPNLFPFPYDWRKSNAAHTQTLHAYIQHIRALHGGAKVNVVAHSMGGLLLRRYILDYGPADFDHVMTVGSPWLGAPMAHYRMFSGNFYGPGFIKTKIDMITRSSMKKALSTLVGAHELLATDLYLANGGSPVMVEDRWDVNNDHLDNNGITIPAYNSAQFRALVDFRTALVEAPLTNPDIPSQNSLIFHNYLGGRQDNWSTDTDYIKYLHVCGKQNTNDTALKVTARTETISLGGYILYERNRFVEERIGVGDGVVPLISAQRLPEYLAPGSRTQTRIIQGPNDEVEHTELMRHPKTYEMLEAFFRDETVPYGSQAGESSALAFASGADVKQRISVTGIGYVSMRDAQGNINAVLSAIAAKQIPGVNVVYGGDEPWVEITADGEVDLTIMGAATNGALEVTSSHVAPDGTASFLRRYRFVPNGHQWQAHFSPANSSPVAEPQLGVDTDDSGTYEKGELLTPTQSSGSGPADTIAPTLNVGFSEENGFIVVGMSAHDDVAVSPLIRYTVNDGPVQKYYNPLHFSLTGSVVLKAFAEDDMGNTSALFTSPVPPLTVPSLGNISTRVRVLSGDDALIGGMIATGAVPKKVIIRAIGPTLTDFGVPGALQNPTLELYQGSTLITSNDDWRQSPQQVEIQNSGLAPSKDAESAIIATLTPDLGYTAVVRGKDGTTGVGVVEAFDLEQGSGSKLGNISTRGFVDVDDNVMIAGLIVSPSNGTSTKVLVRALGPTLGDFGVGSFLANPTLDLVNSSGTVILSNDNWKETQRSEIEAAGLAPSHDEESALVQTVPPGAYTAIVRGSERTIGVGLVEVYNIQ